MNLAKAVVILAVLLSGCATKANYEKVLDSWIGSNADNLVMKWGPPASSYSLSNGGRVLEYSKQRNVQIGGYTTTVPQTTYSSGTASAYGPNGSAYGNYSGTSTKYVQRTAPVQNIVKQCITRFTVNAQGTITKWIWEGNDCKARKPR